MRFINQGEWVEEFGFSAAQRKIIISKFSLPYQEHRLDSIDGFITSSESIIELWYQLPFAITTLPDHRNRLEQISITAGKLLKQLECLPEDCCETLNSESSAGLIDHVDRLGINDHIETLTGRAPELSGLQDLEPLLIGCLSLLAESAGKGFAKANHPVSSGEDRDDVKWLVKKLILSYYWHFSEPIPRTKDSCFFALLSGTEECFAEILGVKIGFKLVNKLLVNTPFTKKFG